MSPPAPAWTTGLAAWYRRHGRHQLPWRHTRDPWAVLVSEVMLQQTQVRRVLDPWRSFLERWPTVDSCAAASLDDVLRAWRGLGYPRRARALRETAARVAAGGWPRDEAALRALPGVGPYTARALLTFALGAPSAPPLDVNIARVAARASLGREPAEVRRDALEATITAARPRGLDPRDYAFALFDAGALHCRAVPRCASCPLAARCASRARLAIAPSPPARRTPRYAGSMRQLRGAILAAALASPSPSTRAALAAAVSGLPQAHAAAVSAAIASLQADGLIAVAATPPAASLA